MSEFLLPGIHGPRPHLKYIYCEKAPPRDVLEASGLVYSLGLKAEYERHVRYFRSYGGNYLIEDTYRVVLADEYKRALPVVWHAPLFELPYEKTCEGDSNFARCLLCGGWIRETVITPENDLRLQKKEELFTSAVPRILYAQPKEAKTAPLGNTPAYEKRVKHLKSHEVAQRYKEKLIKKEETARETFNRIYRPEGKKIDTIQVDDRLDWNKLEKHVQEQHGRAQKTGMPVLGVRQAAEGFGECKSCVRGPYTFTIEYRPGYGVFMRATSSSPQGSVLVSEKSISEADLQTVSVKMVWDKFVEDVWPPAAEDMLQTFKAYVDQSMPQIDQRPICPRSGSLCGLGVGDDNHCPTRAVAYCPAGRR